MFFILSFFSCTKKDEDGFIIVEHKEGKHHAKPANKNKIRTIRKPNSIVIKFDSSCKYSDSLIDDSWNKIYGRGEAEWVYKDGSWKRINETILVWRYNSNTDKFEIAEYTRRFDIKNFEAVIVGYQQALEESEYSLEFLQSTGHIIGPYFGGKKPSPHDLCYYVKFL